MGDDGNMEREGEIRERGGRRGRLEEKERKRRNKGRGKGRDGRERRERERKRREHLANL